MKKLLIILLLLTASFTTYSQALPDSILDNVINELKGCDVLKIEYNKADSTIKVQKKELDERMETITIQKATLENYQDLVQRLEEKEDLVKAEHREEKKALKKRAVGLFIIAVFEAALIILIVL